MKNYVKVPVVMQMEALECGAASLAMVLAYYGKWVPLERVRADCGVSRDGSSARNVLRAARNYGLEAKGFRYDLDNVKTARFPAIIHWNFNHFVVLCGFKRNKALINDPGRGAIEVTMDEFDKAFTGVALEFGKTDAFEPGGKPRSVVGFARERLRGTLMPCVFVILTGLLTAVVGIVSPVFSQIFTDNILSGRNTDWLGTFLIAMSLVVGFQFVVSLLDSVYMLKIRGKLAIVANTSFMWHVLRLPMEFFSQRFAGDIASRQASNETIAETLISQLAPVLLDLVMLVLYFLVMLRYSVLLTCVGITTALINILVTRLIANKRINITRARMSASGKLASTTMAGIEMIETIKASGAENGYFERWAGYQASANNADVRFTRISQYLGAVPGVVQLLANTAVLLIGVYLIITGSFTTGTLLAFQGFMSSFMTPFESLRNVGQSIQEMRSSMERIEDVMNYPVAVEDTHKASDELSDEDDEQFSKLSGQLDIEGLTFGYSKLAPPLIENFDLHLQCGAKVAFVGGSGCGKSTLGKLISGLYEPWSGEIKFDGVPIKDIDRAVFTSSLAVVDQDIIMFEDTIAANIKMWDSSIEDFEMILAARDAQMHEDIMKRDGGYNHLVREGGKNFSGGQRQRFEIARVLAQDPTLVILDEATSALDAQTEFEVINAIKDRGITCIVVAHRLSTIRDCDEIIVLDHGKVIERGTHEELYAQGGQYAKLIATE